MASEEDGEVEPDDADLLDWLWDIPEGPAAGAGSDEPNPFAATPPLRWPGQDNRVGPASPPPGDQATVAVDPVETLDLRRRTQPDPRPGRSAGPTGFGLPIFPAAGREPESAGHDYPPSLAPIFADQRPRRRLSGRRVGAVAAAILVIVVGVGVGYSLLGHGTPSKPPKVTFGSDTTGAPTTLAPAVPIFGDSTTSSTPTSTTGPTTTSSVPAVAVGTTTTMTTVKLTTTTHTTTTVTPTTPLPTIIATVPQGTTTVPPTTTTTVAPTTTTATLLPPIP